MLETMEVATQIPRAQAELPAMGGDARQPSVRAGLWLAVAPVLSLLAFLPIYWEVYRPSGDGLDIAGYPIGRDFINAWAGPRLAFSGHSATLFDAPAYVTAIGDAFGHALSFHTFSYPPTILPFLWPFAQLPYAWAYTLFTVTGLAAFLVAALPLFPRRWWPAAIPCLVLGPTSLINIVGGQNGFFTGALLLGGLRLLADRPVRAGILLGLLVVKPQLGFVLPIALTTLRAWRTAASAAITAAAVMLLSVGLLGTEVWSGFLLKANALSWRMLEAFAGFFTYMMPSLYSGVRLFGGSAATAQAVQLAGTVAVVGTVWIAIPRISDRDDRLFLLASAGPLLTPYLFNYDLPALGAVLASRIVRGETASSATILTLGWLIPGVGMTLAAGGLGVAPLVHGAVFILAAAPWWRRHASPSAEPSRHAPATVLPAEGPAALAEAWRSP